MFLHVTSVSYLDGYKLMVKFNNGTEGVVDLEGELYGEIFEPLRDKKLFQKVFVTSRTIEWPNGADFAPEFLFEIAQLSNQPLEVFPVASTSSFPTTSPNDTVLAAWWHLSASCAQ